MPKSDPPQLVSSTDVNSTEFYVSLPGRLVVGRHDRLDVSFTRTEIEHMTPQAMTAAIEVARMTHAVPAEQETKRSTQEARQITIRHALVVAAVTALGAMACLRSDASAALAGMAAVLGGVYGVEVYTKRKQPKVLPPKT